MQITYAAIIGNIDDNQGCFDEFGFAGVGTRPVLFVGSRFELLNCHWFDGSHQVREHLSEWLGLHFFPVLDERLRIVAAVLKAYGTREDVF